MHKVSTLDDSNCQPDYEYNDTSIDDAIYTIIFPDSRIYVVESQYSLQALADWDAKYAQLHRKVNPKGRYALPRNQGSFKVINIVTLGDLRKIGAKQFRKANRV